MSWRYLRFEVAAIAAAILGTLLFLFAAPPAIGGKTTFLIVRGHSMTPTFAPGDLLLIRQRPSYAPGDVIAYHIPHDAFPAGAVIVHRVRGGDGLHGYVTQGDNPVIKHPDDWKPRQTDVIGKALVVSRGTGRWLLWLRSPLVLALLAAALMASIAVPWAARGNPPTRARPARVTS